MDCEESFREGKLSIAAPSSPGLYHVAVRNTFLEFSDPSDPLEASVEGALAGPRRRALSLDRGLDTMRRGAPASDAARWSPSFGPVAVWPSSVPLGAALLEASSAQNWAGGSCQHWSADASGTRPAGADAGAEAKHRGSMTLARERASTEPGLQSGTEGAAQAQLEPQLQGPITTVMIRNITCRYTQEQVAEFLDQVGLAGKYDFLHLPLNPNRRANLGYMFVNFKTPEYAEECQQLLQGKPLGPSSSEKRCEVAPAHIQGAASVARHSQKKRR